MNITSTPIVEPLNCSRCRFGQPRQEYTKTVPGIGNSQASIMVVGDFPTKADAFLGTPFSGDNGTILENLVVEAGLSVSDLYFTNACKCWAWETKENDRSGNSYAGDSFLTKKEVVPCSVFLKEEINTINPKVILTVGAQALEALEGCRKVTMKDRAGLPSVYKGCREDQRIFIVPTYHPAYVLKSGGFRGAITGQLSSVAEEVVTHIRTAIKLVQNEIAFQEHYYTLIDSRELLTDLIYEIKKRKVCTFDIETTGLSFEDDILGVGFGIGVGVAAYIPFLAQSENDMGDKLLPYWDDKDITREEVVALIKDVLEDPAIQKAAHNSKFDMRGLRKNFGIVVKGLFWDTMCGGYLIDENSSHQLDDMKNEFIDLLGYKDKMNEETDDKKHMERASLYTIYTYCCGDCDATYRLTKKQTKMFHESKPDFYWYMQEFYVPGMEFCSDFEFNGVKYNAPKARSMRDDYSKKALALKEKIIDLVGIPFNIDSGPDLTKILFGHLRLSHTKVTKTKKPSVDEEVLSDLAEEGHPVPQLILDYRHLNKMRSTYMERFIQEVDANDRLHISLNLTGTVTGRPSSEGLQNIPKELDIKSLFIPDKEKVLIQADLSQAEVRCFAHYANEQVLRDAYAAGNIDVHAMIGAQMKNEPYDYFYKKLKVDKDPEYDKIRSAAKSVVFGILYGRGPASIARQLGITLTQAVEFITKFFHTFPLCEEWIDETHKLFEKTGEVTNIFGRVRHIPSIFSSDEEVKARAKRQSVNSIIQSTASDVTILALNRIHKQLKSIDIPANIVLTVYDSIIVETGIEYIDYVVKLLKSTMEEKPHPDFTVNIGADIDIYDAWGIKYKKAA